ncbi:MAG: ATP-binding protein [Candidatus Omnitrophica bacterium]|nr:ATP-binding protein [Candidatus Omnitrophota bacterium]
MNMIHRYLENSVAADLKDKMVFISGPRQVGKTTLARIIGEHIFSGKYDYLNWDNRQDRRSLLDGVFKADADLVIFDEIHKYKSWKNYIKGEFDKYKDRFKFIVTGSARLDIYRRGGESLLGRYHAYRLHPLSLRELLAAPLQVEPFHELIFGENNKEHQKLFAGLFKFGGFPELFSKQNEKTLRRWHNERVDRLIKEDIRDIEQLRDISALQVLVELIPGKVGSLFSVNSLREDLGVTHRTVSLWVDVLEKFYYHYRIYPFQSNLIKSLRKEPKVYLWDWSEIKDESIRLENFIASHLLKFCDYLFDVEGFKAKLYYLRDNEQREVDFLVAIDNKPWFCVEVKKTYKDIPASLKYFQGKLKIPYVYQVVADDPVDFIKDKVRVMSAGKFVSGLV